jgi:hypothetical protein
LEVLTEMDCTKLSRPRLTAATRKPALLYAKTGKNIYRKKMRDRMIDVGIEITVDMEEEEKDK